MSIKPVAMIPEDEMLAAAKEPATCSVCGLKRSDTKNCNAPDCSPMLAAAKEKGE